MQGEVRRSKSLRRSRLHDIVQELRAVAGAFDPVMHRKYFNMNKRKGAAVASVLLRI